MDLNKNTRNEDTFEEIISNDLIKTVIQFYRDHTNITGYVPNDLYRVNDQNDIAKIWIPVPWWNPDGYFKVIEFCLINIPHMFPDIMSIKLDESKELQFFDRNRINSYNVFFIYDTKMKIRQHYRNNIYFYNIKNNPLAPGTIVRLICRSINAVHTSIQNAKFLKPTAKEFLEISEEFLAILDARRREEIKRINNAPEIPDTPGDAKLVFVNGRPVIKNWGHERHVV